MGTSSPGMWMGCLRTRLCGSSSPQMVTGYLSHFSVALLKHHEQGNLRDGVCFGLRIQGGKSQWWWSRGLSSRRSRKLSAHILSCKPQTGLKFSNSILPPARLNPQLLQINSITSWGPCVPMLEIMRNISHRPLPTARGTSE